MTQSANLTLLLTNQAIQSKLIDFIKDPYITELMTGITKYMQLCDKPELRKHAEQKATQLIDKIKKYFEQSQLRQPVLSQAQKDYQVYKTLSQEGKIQCLIKAEDIESMEQHREALSKDLFQITLSRIVRVINFNYFDGFYRSELLALNEVHVQKRKELGFNANGDDLPCKKATQRNCNIFTHFGNAHSIQRQNTLVRQSSRVNTQSMSSFRDSQTNLTREERKE